MNLKSYLSGLGLGIIVTALILSIAGGKKEMSDDEIMSRAQELGMTDTAEVLTKETDSTSAKVTGTTVAKTASTSAAKETGTAEAKATSTTAAKETGTAEAKATSKAAAKETGTTEAKATSTTSAKKKDSTVTSSSSTEKAKTASISSSTQVSSTSSQKTVSTSSKKETEAGAAGKTQTITIVAGDSSYSVAQKLEKAGLVESAAEYDSYLCSNGYDRKIRTGTFTVTDGDSKEQIANAITGR